MAVGICRGPPPSTYARYRIRYAAKGFPERPLDEAKQETHPGETRGGATQGPRGDRQLEALKEERDTIEGGS